MEPELNNDYLDAGVDLNALDDITTDGRPTVLDKLGPAHFRSKGFSFMGFLQTVYDHVAEQTTRIDRATVVDTSNDAAIPDETSKTAAAIDDSAAETEGDADTALVDAAPADGAEALPTDLADSLLTESGGESPTDGDAPA